jgi:DNA-binding transcriptional LysR family regulator
LPFDDETLRVLVSLASDTNLRRAATELGVPRSTLSRKLVEIEERLGQPLFLRRGRALVKTSFGELLIAQARTAKVALEDLAAAAASGAGSRTLVLAASPLFAELVLPSVLASLLEVHPSTRVRVVLSHGYSDIFDERVDVALRRGPLADSSSLSARRLGTLSMICVARGLLARSAGGATDEEVRAWPWIRVASSVEPFTLRVATRGRARTLALVPRVAVDSQRLALDLALRGLGVARVNAFLARSALERGDLVEVLPDARESEAVFAVHPRRARPDALVRELVGTVVKRCRELDIWDP